MGNHVWGQGRTANKNHVFAYWQRFENEVLSLPHGMVTNSILKRSLPQIYLKKRTLWILQSIFQRLTRSSPYICNSSLLYNNSISRHSLQTFEEHLRFCPLSTTNKEERHRHHGKTRSFTRPYFLSWTIPRLNMRCA